MSEIVEFKLESGGTVFVESTGDGSSGAGRAGGRDQVVKAASMTFEAALDQVKPAAEAVVKAFRELNQPDEIGIEFGLTLTSKANGFVLSGDASASFKLSLKWKSEKA